jgi:hypothetical protein
VGGSAIFSTCQGHPGNDALVATTPFSKIRRNDKEPNQMIMEGEETQTC